MLAELESKPRSVFSTDMIKNDVKKIQNIYKRSGYFSTFVEPKYIRLDQNRVNLVFEVYEGKEATIKKINSLSWRRRVLLNIDGGINNKNIDLINSENVVSGSYVIKSKDPIKNIMTLF